MAEWRTPITDRTSADASAARKNQSNQIENKGALNYTDLNRIEDNYKYILEHLATDAFHIPHEYRSYTEKWFESVEKPAIDLPEGGTLLKYIESSGTQFIDTGFKPNQDTGFVLDADILATNNGTNNHIMSVNGASTYFALRITSDKTAYASRWNTEGLKNVSHSGNVFGRHLFVRDKNVISIDGQASVISTYAAFTQPYSLPILCFRGSTGTASEFTNARLYGCKLFDNGIMIRDFVPYKNEADIVGMFDLVNMMFYGNAGTGEFIAGPEAEVETILETIQVEKNYIDWHEANIPWLSEMNRIRANYNALVRLFLVKLGLPILDEINYLYYTEVNDWERIAEVGKTIFENMEQEYIYCGTMDSGGDRLL